MSILYIVDNKYRDLWGFYDIRNKLSQKNKKLFFCNKFNWNRAIRYINPSVIITPHIRKDSPHFRKIIDYAYEKKIKVVVFPSESLDYRKEFMENELPEEVLDKIEKMFLWSNEQGQFVSKKHKNKIVITGSTRFENGELNSNGKIKTIGIISSGRYLAPLTGNTNLLYFINSRQKHRYHISWLKNEVEFIDFLCQVIMLAKENNLKVIFKPHPFENIKIYQDAFPDLVIEQDPDIRVFFKKVDVCLNQISSANLQAFANKIPVINVSNALNISKQFKDFNDIYPPSKLGIPINNLDELKRLITVNNIEDLLKMNIDRGDVKNFRELVPEYETINIISDELSKMDVENKRKSFINFFPYLLKEIYLIIMKSNRETLFRAFSNKDEKIIKKFSIN